MSRTNGTLPKIHFSKDGVVYHGGLPVAEIIEVSNRHWRILQLDDRLVLVDSGARYFSKHDAKCAFADHILALRNKTATGSESSENV
jgi:hypothetical protein